MSKLHLLFVLACVLPVHSEEPIREIIQVSPVYLDSVDPAIGQLVGYLKEAVTVVNKAIELKISHRVGYPDGRESYSNVISQFPLTGFNNLFTIEGSPFAIPSSDGGKHSERHCKISFDGDKWVTKTFKLGNPGNVFEVKEAEISAQAPDVLNNYVVTSGAAILPTTLRTFKHSVSLNGLLSGVTKTIFTVEIAQDPKYGKTVVINSTGSPERIELSVKNNFALIRHTASGKQWSKKIEVSDLQEIVPNFWVPKSYVFETLEPGDMKFIRKSIIESVRLVDISEINGGIVQKLEPGYRVHDLRTDIRFTVGEPQVQ